MPCTRKYPDNWEEMAAARKAEEGHKCERCGVEDSHKPADGNCLTVHHLVPDTSLNEDWNLAVLCQRCHLHMQNVDLFQGYLFEIDGWLKKHVDGFRERLSNKKIKGRRK